MMDLYDIHGRYAYATAHTWGSEDSSQETVSSLPSVGSGNLTNKARQYPRSHLSGPVLFCFVFETESGTLCILCCTVFILMSQFPECWGCRCVLPLRLRGSWRESKGLFSCEGSVTMEDAELRQCSLWLVSLKRYHANNPQRCAWRFGIYQRLSQQLSRSLDP